MPTSLRSEGNLLYLPHGREYEDCKQILEDLLTLSLHIKARQDFSLHSRQKTCPNGQSGIRRLPGCLRSINPATAGCSLQKPSGLFAYRSRGLDVSTHYLSRIIYRQTGRTLKDWIADTLMVEIKYHLTCTDKTIEEISEDLSFCSTSAFIQYFKSKTGCTPFKYRRDQNLKTQ